MGWGQVSVREGRRLHKCRVSPNHDASKIRTKIMLYVSLLIAECFIHAYPRYRIVEY